jgi:hypothetical protein
VGREIDLGEILVIRSSKPIIRRKENLQRKTSHITNYDMVCRGTEADLATRTGDV